MSKNNTNYYQIDKEVVNATINKLSQSYRRKVQSHQSTKSKYKEAKA